MKERPPTNLHTATIVCSEMRLEYSTLEDVLQRNGSGRGWDMCAVLERHKNLLARLANRLVDGRDHCMSSWRLVGMRCGPWVTAHCGQQGSRCLQPARPVSSDRSGLDSDASHPLHVRRHVITVEQEQWIQWRRDLVSKAGNLQNLLGGPELLRQVFGEEAATDPGQDPGQPGGSYTDGSGGSGGSVSVSDGDNEGNVHAVASTPSPAAPTPVTAARDVAPPAPPSQPAAASTGRASASCKLLTRVAIMLDTVKRGELISENDAKCLLHNAQLLPDLLCTAPLNSPPGEW